MTIAPTDMIKPKPIVTPQQKVFFLFVCIAVFFLGMFVVFGLLTNSKGLLTGNSSIYSEAYRPKIEQAQEARRLEALQKKQDDDAGEGNGDSSDDSGSSASSDSDNGDSAQPRPIGFSEKDIYKAKGRRYQTW